MTLQEFKMNSLEQQQHELLRSSVYLGERKTALLRVKLFQLHGFYVEVFFFNQFYQLMWFESFDSLDRLNTYLEEIDLTVLDSLKFS